MLIKFYCYSYCCNNSKAGYWLFWENVCGNGSYHHIVQVRNNSEVLNFYIRAENIDKFWEKLKNESTWIKFELSFWWWWWWEEEGGGSEEERRRRRTDDFEIDQFECLRKWIKSGMLSSLSLTTSISIMEVRHESNETERWKFHHGSSDHSSTRSPRRSFSDIVRLRHGSWSWNHTQWNDSKCYEEGTIASESARGQRDYAGSEKHYHDSAYLVQRLRDGIEPELG